MSERSADVTETVYMRHSRSDNAVPFVTAEMTSKLLPSCRFEAREDDAHFSKEVLDDFIQTVMAGCYAKGVSVGRKAA